MILFGPSGTKTDRLQLELLTVGIRPDLEMVVLIAAAGYLGEETQLRKLEFHTEGDGTARHTYRGLQTARR